MNKKATIIGPYIYHNFGDDLIGMVIASHLLKNNFTPIIPHLDKANCDWIGCESILDKKRAIKKSTKLIIGGGGILGDAGIKPDDIYRKISLKAAIYAKLHGKKTIVTGVGAGPLSKTISKLLTRAICMLANNVGVRDIQSFEFLKSLSVNNKKITEGADVALLWPNYLPIKTEKEEQIGIQFDPQNFIEYSNNKHRDTIKKQIVNFAKSNTATIITNGDYESYLNEYLNDESLTKLKYKEMSSFLNEFSKLKIIFTSHLHLAIAAYANRIPCFSLYVREKTKRFYDQIGHPERALDIANVNPESLNNLLNDMKKAQWTDYDEKNLERLKSRSKMLLEII